MANDSLIQLSLPVALVEDLLRRRQLHLEDIQSLDGATHRELTAMVKRSLKANGRMPAP